ncbi:MAG: hybrid sensor histidine kinase/response regulator [Myxococcales bacterium]
MAGALHDVSNALTVVVGWLEVALGKSAPHEVIEAIDVALSHARFGHRVARRAIGGTSELESTCSELSAVIENSLNAVKPFAERRAIRVEVQGGVSHGHAVLVENPDAATQILVNLLLNSLAFTPERGRVLITTRVSRHSVVITVADEGPGISADRAATILEAPNSTRQGGTGIGLTHSAALARDCGGHLRLVRHAPNAVFELRWQRADSGMDGFSELPPGGDESSRPYSSRPINALELAGLNVLLLEDDEAICSLVELAFFSRGSIVRSASTLAQAGALSASQQFDVALVDLSPIASDVSAGLAQLRAKHDLPVVLITGSAVGLPPNTERQFAAWVRKPFEAGELIDAVRRVTGRDATVG